MQIFVYVLNPPGEGYIAAFLVLFPAREVGPTNMWDFLMAVTRLC